MNWEELEKKHAKEWQLFEEFKNLEWEKLQERNSQILEAFGNKEDELPTSQKIRKEEELNEWNMQWGEEGEKSAALKEIQALEKQELIDSVSSSITARLTQIKKRDRDRER